MSYIGETEAQRGEGTRFRSHGSHTAQGSAEPQALVCLIPKLGLPLELCQRLLVKPSQGSVATTSTEENDLESALEAEERRGGAKPGAAWHLVGKQDFKINFFFLILLRVLPFLVQIATVVYTLLSFPLFILKYA